MLRARAADRRAVRLVGPAAGSARSRRSSALAVDDACSLLADSFAVFAVVAMLQGVYRALDSGPARRRGTSTPRSRPTRRPKLERGLVRGRHRDRRRDRRRRARQRRARRLDPLPGGRRPCVLPVLLALGSAGGRARGDRAAGREAPHRDGPSAGCSPRCRDVPTVDRRGRPGRARASRSCWRWSAVELCWGFGMVTFETLMPVRLSEVVGGPEAGRGDHRAGRRGGVARLGGRGRADHRWLSAGSGWRAPPACCAIAAGHRGGRHGPARRRRRGPHRLPRVLPRARRLRPGAHDAAAPRGRPASTGRR